MPHEIGLIATIAAGFGLAMVFGYVAVRLRMPPLVGYLFAGVAIGPATPGLVADVGLAQQLAEIGVMLLLFGVGRHVSLVVAVPDTVGVRRMVEIARTLKPGISVVLRTHGEEEAALLDAESQGKVFLGEHEQARGTAACILGELRRGRASN